MNQPMPHSENHPIPVVPAPPPLQHVLLRQLDQIQVTPQAERWPATNWPSERAFADAGTFIRTLPTGLVLSPSIGLADDGEVNFLWDHDGLHIDLGFYGTGAFSYFARAQDGRRLYGNDLPADCGLPAELAGLVGV